MIIGIISPIKAYIEFDSSEEALEVRNFLSYRNTSKFFILRKHLAKDWLQRKDPEGWEEERKRLQAEVDCCLLNKDEKGFWIRPGLIPYLEKFKTTVYNYVKYPDLNTLTWVEQPEFEPYPYQSLSVEKLINEKHGCVSLPTGCGKTYVAKLLTKQIGDVVVVTPSESIFNELLDDFTKSLGEKNVGGYGDGKKNITKKVTVAIAKSLTMLKEGTEAYDFFKNKKALIVDESHTFAAETLENVCHGVLSDISYRFFVSATQTRGDGAEKLLNSIIGKNVLEMSIKEAIDKKYLCPLKFTIIESYSPSSLNKKDSIENNRVHFLYNNELAKLSALIANSKWENMQESTLILVEELVQIQMLTKLLKVPYTYVHSASKKEASMYGLKNVSSKEEVDRFNRGEVKVLIGTKAIATGTNIYPTHNVINLVGGSSEIKTKQGTMGRSTRILENSKFKNFHKAKPYTMVYDFKIKNNDKLIKQLKERIKFYKESDGEFFEYKM